MDELVRSEGIHFKIPYLQQPIMCDIREKSLELDFDVSSKGPNGEQLASQLIVCGSCADLESVPVTITVAVQPVETELVDLYRH